MFDSSSYTLWKLAYIRTYVSKNNNGYKIYVCGFGYGFVGIGIALDLVLVLDFGLFELKKDRKSGKDRYNTIYDFTLFSFWIV